MRFLSLISCMIFAITACKKSTGIKTDWSGNSFPGNIKIVESGFYSSYYQLFSYNSDGLISKIQISNSNKEEEIEDWCDFDWQTDSLILNIDGKEYRFKRDGEGYVLPITGDTTWNWTYDANHQITSITSLNFQNISTVNNYTWENGEIKTYNGIGAAFEKNLDNRNYGIKYFPSFMIKIVDCSSYSIQSKSLNTGGRKPYFDKDNRIEKCNQGDDYFHFYYYEK